MIGNAFVRVDQLVITDVVLLTSHEQLPHLRRQVLVRLYFRTHRASLLHLMDWVSSVSEDSLDLLFIETDWLHFILELGGYHLHSVPRDHLLSVIVHVVYCTDITHIQGGILYHNVWRERSLFRKRVT